MIRRSLAVFATVGAVLLAMINFVYAQDVGPQAVDVQQAAMGTAFTYQGQLKSGGAGVTGPCEMAFRLYDAVTAGNPIGSPITQTVTVNAGLFTTQLDFGASAFNGQGRWLETAVKCGSDAVFTALSRQALTPAPYALYATSASWSGLSGIPAGFADGIDNDTVYTAGVGLDLTGNQFMVESGYRLPQSCLAGQIPEWNGLTSRWSCGTDNNTTYTAGSGLALVGTEFSVTGAPWSGLTGVPAGFADGIDDAGSDWHLIGNAGTNPTTNFIGTTDNQPLVFKVNSQQVFRLEPNVNSPNIIGGRNNNSVTNAHGATISGGGANSNPNEVTANFGTIGGGYSNVVSGSLATIGGGTDNTVGSYGATIAGGCGNEASAAGAVVGGGGCFDGGYSGNDATGVGSTVSGGISNEANGYAAAVGGGKSNWVDGDYSFAAGYRAKNTNDTHDGVFIFADSNSFDFYSSAANQFRVRSTGGAQFVTAIDGSGNPIAGVQVAAGGGSWTSLSDRNFKSNFADVDGRAVLKAVAEMPIQTWNYIAQNESIRHIGPMAQDFYAAFGVGEDDTHITTVDADGVALAALQGLNEIVREKEARIIALEEHNAALEARLTALEQFMPANAQGAPSTTGTIALLVIGTVFGFVVMQIPRHKRRR